MASKAPKPSRRPRAALPAPGQLASDAALPSTEDLSMDATTGFTTSTTDAQTATKTVFAEATERAKGALGKGQAMFGEMAEFGKGNVEALVESGRIYAKGVEAMGQNAAAYVRASVEDAQAQARTLASVGSPTDFFKLQGDFARQSFEKMVAETSKNTEAMMKLAGEVAQPLSNRAALAMEKVKVAA